MNVIMLHHHSGFEDEAEQQIIFVNAFGTSVHQRE